MKIPIDFYSFETDQPFESCIRCENGFDENSSYTIQKTFRSYDGDFSARDVLMEMAICQDCSIEMSKAVSKESYEAIMAYSKELMKHQMGSQDHGYERCLVTGQKTTEMKEYVIYGSFKGMEVAIGRPLIALDVSVLEALDEQLSQETRDYFDDFVKEHFSGPPELNDIFAPRRPVLI